VTHGSNEVGRDAGATTARSVNQTVALALGVIYTLVALIGFLFSGVETFAGNLGEEDGAVLGIFSVNHLHNIVHLLIGVALIAASRRHDSARGANLAVGATYVLVGILGLFINGDNSANILALNGADNGLHLASGAALLATALLADKNRARARS
jgi:amino acid permease